MKKAQHKQDHKMGDRCLILVDIENLVGSGRCTENDVSAVKEQISEMISIEESDQVIVGASHKMNAFNAGMAWREARLVFKNGKDGADLALLETMGEGVANRFGKVVIASGDGAFQPYAEHLQRAGVKVTIIARRDHLSHALMGKATKIIAFPSERFLAPDHGPLLPAA